MTAMVWCRYDGVAVGYALVVQAASDSRPRVAAHDVGQPAGPPGELRP
jgi:hypothetical protein